MSRRQACSDVPSIAKMLVVVLAVSVNGIMATGSVKEINKGNLKELLTGKLFVLTYVTSTSCVRCHNLFPFFAAASQAFFQDEEIFFARTYDRQLIQEWGITELPALVYHKKGVDANDVYGNRNVLDVDVTVDDITSGIEQILHGNFDDLEKRYSLRLDANNYDEMVNTPTQSVMVMLYDKETKHDSIPVFERAAYAFRKDDGILFASLNVETHSKLRDAKFKTKETPAVMWIAEGQKNSPKRFGGMLTKELIVSFINERTGLNRLSSGALLNEAGRIPSVDTLLEEHADLVFKAEEESLTLLSNAIQDLKSSVQDHQTSMLYFYLQVIDEIRKTGAAISVLENFVLIIEASLYNDEDEPSTKTKELLRRQMNVVKYFSDVIKLYQNGQWQETNYRLGIADSKVTLTKPHVHTEL